MLEIPQSWVAYASLQKKLSKTNSIEYGASLEAALCIILEPDYSVEATTESEYITAAASASRLERYRNQLRRQYLSDVPVGIRDDENNGFSHYICGPSLEEEVHARRELARLASTVGTSDWTLLFGVAIGMSYEELAHTHNAPAGTLRTRVARLRRALSLAEISPADQSNSFTRESDLCH